MNIITVIPLERTRLIDSLSYFTGTNVPIGAIVSVPIRNKSVLAIVVETRPAEDIKQEIKNAPYEIKKLGRLRTTAFFPAPFVEVARKLANFYVSNFGSVVDALVSQDLLENTNKIEMPEVPQGGALSRRLNLENVTYAIQGDDEDRMSAWRSLIRQEFAKKKSVVFYVPTIEDALNITLALNKGIEEYIYTLHGLHSEKTIIELWNKIAKENHPVVIIATASFSLLPRADIDTIIIERENSRGWMTQKAPYMDLRHALETLAHVLGQVVYRADSLLKLETLHKLENHELSQGSPFKWRSVSLAKDVLVDMTGSPLGSKNSKDPKNPEDSRDPRELKGKDPVNKKFRIISPELEELIRKNREESSHLFILATRRGLSPITVCDDCDTIISCKKCGAPLVLHKSQENSTNFFLCHVCGDRREADAPCEKCGGWRMSLLGIGIERVEEELKRLFPFIEIFRIDSDTAKSSKKIHDVIQKFKAHPGSILLGTELALTYINEKVDHSAIVSMDSLFALPDYRIPEKIMYLLTRLRTLSDKTFLVQTRRSEEPLFEFGLKGNLSDFYRQIINDRKTFGFPPFVKLVKISIEGKREAIANLMAEIKKDVESFPIDVFPSFTKSSRGNSIIHGLMRLDARLWPNTELISKLRALPPSVSVRVDPESLL